MRALNVLRVLVSIAGLWVSLGASAQQSRPAITGIAFVRFYSSDFAASDGFYNKILGYERVVGADLTVRYGVNAAQWIELEKLPVDAPQGRLVEIAFTTRNLLQLERYLKQHKVPMVGVASRESFAVHDPEGHTIAFVQQGAMKGRFSLSTREVSRRLVHAGIVVHDRAAEDAFYRDLLGFHLYWAGSPKPNEVDYVAMQVPDGTDWIEYMLNSTVNPNAHQLGGMNHVSLGVTHISDAVAALSRNGCTEAGCTKTRLGADGKVQLNLYDPDLTRIELMDFAPTGPVCCSGIPGREPGEEEDR